MARQYKTRTIQTGIPDPFWDPTKEKTDVSALADGFIGYTDGMNAGVDLLALKETACAMAINTTFRKLIPRTRPAFISISGMASIPGEYCAGSAVYSLNSGDSMISVIDGRIYSLDLESNVVRCLSTEYSLPKMKLPYNKAWFCQAEHFMIVQDGESVPVIISPDSVRLAVQSTKDPNGEVGYEVPTGTIMAYGHGRLFVVPKTVAGEDGRRFFLAGDIVWSTKPEKLLKFTETEYFAGGGAIALPNEMGFISGMAFMRSNGTGDGMGALIVFARGGASAFAVNAPRLTWQEIDISQVLFQSGGTLAPDAIIPVNSDIFFRGIDGIRSLVYQANSSQVLSNVSISEAAGSILSDDDEWVQAFSTAVHWDNYFMMTVNRNHETDTWNGMIVMDLAQSSINGAASPMITTGVWTQEGLCSIHHVRMDGYRKVLMVCKINGAFTLKVIDDTASRQIRSRLYTGALSFSTPFSLKQIASIQISVSEVAVDSTINIYARPRGYPKFLFIGSITLPQVENYGRYSLFTIPVDSDAGCDPLTGEALLTADEFQFCIEVTGNLKIDKFKAMCSLVTTGPRLIDELSTGDHATFPGVDIEAEDFSNTGSEA